MNLDGFGLQYADLSICKVNKLNQNNKFTETKMLHECYGIILSKNSR